MEERPINIRDIAEFSEEVDKAADKQYPPHKDPRRIADILGLIKAYWRYHTEKRLVDILSECAGDDSALGGLDDLAIIDRLREMVDSQTSSGRFEY